MTQAPRTKRTRKKVLPKDIVELKENPAELKEWDPQDHERVSYRDSRTGQLGYFVRRGGKDCIRLDRGNQELIVPFVPGQWVEEGMKRPWTRAQISRVAWEADRALCHLLGDHEKARREWESMHEDDRVEWIRVGPAKPLERALLYRLVMDTVHEMTGQ